jgi:O-methyltransferase
VTRAILFDEVSVSLFKSEKALYFARVLWYLRLHRKYRERTMVPAIAYAENLALTARALDNPALDGAVIVECGTWRGGMSAGMIEVGGPNREYYFFDSFEGMPPVQDLDGPAAHKWQVDPTVRRFGICDATMAEFDATIRMTGCRADIIHTTKGFFEQSFPGFTPPPVAILRLDADWYASTAICLEKFWDSMLPGGLILIDDYYAWDGCSRAIHDGLAKRQATERVSQTPFSRCAFIVKQ